MQKLDSKWLLTAALAAALLAGCGGGDDSGGSSAASVPANSVPAPAPGAMPVMVPPDLAQTITAVFDYISRLVASNSDSSEPADINSVTLATDDTSSPTSLP